eukprot:scaffold9127_cov88-Skeletonema_dohrnii-CCMP3373.AAC.1
MSTILSVCRWYTDDDMANAMMRWTLIVRPCAMALVLWTMLYTGNARIVCNYGAISSMILLPGAKRKAFASKKKSVIALFLLHKG